MSESLQMPMLSTFTMDELFGEISRRTRQAVLVIVPTVMAQGDGARIHFNGGLIPSLGLIDYAQMRIRQVLTPATPSEDTA